MGDHGRRVGMGRLDRCPGGAEVSLALIPAVRGRGLACLLIRALLRRLRGLRWGSRARATVNARNARSLRAFTRVGFVVRRLEGGPRGPWLGMERRL